MKIKPYYLSFMLLLSLSLIFISTYSCSDDSSYEEEDIKAKQPDSSYNLSKSQKIDHWLNPNNTCSSGWVFHPYQKCSKESFGVKSYKEASSTACGIKGKSIKCNRCRHSSFGLETRVVKDKTFNKLRGDNQTCSDISQETIDSLKQTYNPQKFIIHLDFIKNSTSKLPPFGFKFQSCMFRLRVEEILGFREQEDCSVCGSSEEIIYNTCRHPSHGVEEYNSKISKECGINEKETICSSNKDLSKQDIQNKEGEIIGCSTCDDISFDPSNMDEPNQKALIKRINCLLDNLNKTTNKDITYSLIKSELRQLLNYSDIINKVNPDLLNRVKEKI